MFKPCILIPVYNHSKNIAVVVERLSALPIVMLDDGSDTECRRTLEALSAANNAVVLIRFEQNRGKGAVVCDGLRWAYREGYTHALQVDADGQHDLADVPMFLQMAQEYPKSIISGWRNYKQLPGSRRYGRFITDLWVWINTLSLQIKDSMCGYRLYPLPSTIALLSSESVGQRMDFDTDIMVRLYWRGVNVKHIATQVNYSDDISSHFKLVRDNLRISLMHSRLFCGMIVRLPKLLRPRSKR